MKKLIFTIATLFIAISANAQSVEALEKKLTKSDAAINDAKKSIAPGTWLDRATIYFDLANVYTADIAFGLPVSSLAATIGEPTSKEVVTISGAEYVKSEYENFTLYTTESDGAIQFWTQKKGDEYGRLISSIESLEKMKSLSSKDFIKKGGPLSEKIQVQLSHNGRTEYSLGKPEAAAANFEGAARSAQLREVIDTISIYFSGLAYLEAQNWQKAEAAFDKALSYGLQESGNVHVNLANCYLNLDKQDQAIKILEAGFASFPNNSNLLASLINVYLKNNIDPQKVIDLINKAQALEPTNQTLYTVEGTVWYKIGNAENAEKAFEKAISINPNDFNTYFNLGLIRAQQVDAFIEKAKAVDINDNKTYNALVDDAIAIYKESIKAFEKAYELDSTNIATIETLRALYFQIRDEDEAYAKKYDFYDNLLKSGK